MTTRPKDGAAPAAPQSDDLAIRASIQFQAPDLFGNTESKAPPHAEMIRALIDRSAPWRMTQKALAAEIDYDEGNLSNVKNGKQKSIADPVARARLIDIYRKRVQPETAERSDAISAKLDAPETVAAPIEARGADATPESTPVVEQAEIEPAPRANLDGFAVRAPKAPRIARSLAELIDDARSALAAVGIEVETLKPNAGWQRLKHQDHLWYIADAGTGRSGSPWLMVTAGNAKETGDVKTPTVVFKSWERGADAVSQEDREAIKRQLDEMAKQREAEDRANRERARQEGQGEWDQASDDCGEHPYLVAKGVGAHGIRRAGNRLLIPVRDPHGVLHGLQRITGTGEQNKRFSKGTSTTGHFHLISTIKDDGPLCIAEGYATAASIHEATHAPVAVAFNCGNLPPVAKALRAAYPKQTIVICADDDRHTSGNPGVTHANEAARAVGGLVVIPRFTDPAGRGTDFNDLAQAEGLDVVREQIGQVIEAAGLEAESDPVSVETGTESAEVTDDDADAQDAPPAPVFPPANERPRYVVLDDWAKYKGKKQQPGVYWCTTKERPDGDLDLIEDWVCTPLHVDAITFDEQQDNFGRLLRFKNTLGKWREWAMPMEMLAGKGDELRARLLNMGVEFHPYHGRRELPIYLQGEHPKRRMHCATQTGWVGECFVLPDVVIGPTSAGVIFQSAERITNEYTVKGTLAGWQSEIAARAVGNPLLLTALSASFAGPLMGRCIIEGGGVHFYGPSSCGKTTLVVAACSTWGGSGYKRSWKGTANGQEGVAALFNDNLLALDEISEADPREVGAIVYQLGNGTGKQRAGRSGHARPVVRWRCVILSSGERTVATTMLEGGQRAKAGQSVRLLDVPVARRYGTWDTLHDLPTGERFSDAIKRAAETHHGHAGRAFLERLTREKQDFSLMLEAIKAMPLFAAEGEEGQDKRAAARFALIGMAGELATEYGITGWSKGEALKAAAECFRLWQAERGTGNDERRQILERVARFIDRHGDSRFSDADAHDSSRVVYDRAGWWKDGPGGRQYLFNADGMRDALASFDFRRALDVLQEIGALPAPNANGERARFHRIDGRAIKLYPVFADKLTGGEHGA
jgi:putative DNA primase/helicase